MNKNTLIIADGTKNLNDVRQYITNVVIPDSVTKIGDEVFFGCISLAEITIPNDVVSIGRWALAGCTSLSTINIPDSVTSIGDWALAGCISLTEIIIPDGVTSIGEGAFFKCSSLESIYIDKEKDTLDLSKTCIPTTTKVYWKGEWDKEENNEE